MAAEATKRWIQAGITLGRDPAAAVRCPDCGERDLVVEDIPLNKVLSESGWAEWHTPHMDRLMRCPGCGAHNYLLMRKLDS
jgi:DNA-directed RNA polymerase subunit RPC12/RpoP